MDLLQIKQQALNFFEKLPKHKITEYECPACHAILQTVKPGYGEEPYWDSLKSCYECGAKSFSQVFPNGKVKIISQHS